MIIEQYYLNKLGIVYCRRGRHLIYKRNEIERERESKRVVRDMPCNVCVYVDTIYELLAVFDPRCENIYNTILYPRIA